jgi:hypothetical protein
MCTPRSLLNSLAADFKRNFSSLSLTKVGCPYNVALRYDLCRHHGVYWCLHKWGVLVSTQIVSSWAHFCCVLEHQQHQQQKSVRFNSFLAGVSLLRRVENKCGYGMKCHSQS